MDSSLWDGLCHEVRHNGAGVGGIRVGIVRIEDDQVVTDEIDGVLEGDFGVYQRNVGGVCVCGDDALAGEVFAGLEVQSGVLPIKALWRPPAWSSRV